MGYPMALPLWSRRAIKVVSWTRCGGLLELILVLSVNGPHAHCAAMVRFSGEHLIVWCPAVARAWGQWARTVGAILAKLRALGDEALCVAQVHHQAFFGLFDPW
jgi:hypothetical protein